MSDQQVGEKDQTDLLSSHGQESASEEVDRKLAQVDREVELVDEEVDHLSILAGNLLDRSDTIIYSAVGLSFLLGAFFALGYSFWDFSTTVIRLISDTKSVEPTLVANAIIQFVSDLLLVLIITEVLGTVIHYLKAHETSLRPFLFIGIVSATRGILSVGAKLSVERGQVDQQFFTNAMIELGVSAAVVLALGITLKLLAKLFEK